MFNAILSISILIAGILLMVISSDKAVEHSILVASTMGMSPLMIGVLLVSLGTDLPEIANSIISCALGHGSIDAGDSIGSVLTQLTLVLGILPFFGGAFKVKRDEIMVIGACEVLALLLVFSIVEKGNISRINALFLVGSWALYMLITKVITGKGLGGKDPARLRVELAGKRAGGAYSMAIAVLGFIGVAVGAYAVIQSVITLSTNLKVPEYLISFFAVSIGTSLPELAVDLTALRKGECEIAIGDIIGSCIVDASFSIGIGQVFFPQRISGELASSTTFYTLLASVIVISTLAVREKVDKKAGVLFILLYLLSYTLLLMKF